MLAGVACRIADCRGRHAFPFGFAVLIIGAIVLTNTGSQSKTGDDSGTAAQAASNPAPVPKIRYLPVSQKIAKGQIVVKANG